MNRQLIESGLRKLGPERCEQALVAFSPDNEPEGWKACLLARAYGPPGALLADVWAQYTTSFCEVAARLLGLTVAETAALARTYDASLDGEYPELRQLVEAEAMKARPLASGYFVTSG